MLYSTYKFMCDMSLYIIPWYQYMYKHVDSKLIFLNISVISYQTIFFFEVLSSISRELSNYRPTDFSSPFQTGRASCLAAPDPSQSLNLASCSDPS